MMEDNMSETEFIDLDLTSNIKSLIIKDAIVLILEDGTRWNLDIDINADKLKNLPTKYHLTVLKMLQFGTRFMSFYNENIENEVKKVNKPWWRFW